MSSTRTVARSLDGPAVLLVVALLVSLVASTSPANSLPAFWATLIGLASVYACAYLCGTPRGHRLIAPTWLGLSLVLASVGLLVMHPPPEKLFSGGHVYAGLERVAATIHLSRYELDPNEVGGALALIVPLSVVVAVTPRPAWMWALAIMRAGFLLVALLLTQSRGAIVAVAGVLVLGAVWRSGRRFRPWLLGGLALGACVASIVFGSAAIQHLVLDDASDSPASSLSGRMELWRRGLLMLVDMPITGIGLNGFAVLLPQVDPTLGQLDPSVRQHAHDIYLQTALDLGLPGLVAIATLGWRAARAGVQSAERGPTTLRPLAIGLVLGLLAYALHGLVEVVGLSTGPGLIAWITIGLLMALGSASPRRLHDEGRPDTPRNAAENTGICFCTACRVSRRNLSKEVRPTATCSETRLVGRTSGRFPGRSSLQLVGVVMAVGLLVAPVALNGAWLALRRADSPVAAGPALGADLDVAAWMAWGPFPARVSVARAFAARSAADRQLDARPGAEVAPMA